jgi:hypothetical protein
VAIAKLGLGILHLTKIEFNGSLILNDGLLLIVENLFGNSVRGECLTVASKINLSLFEDSAIMVQ